ALLYGALDNTTYVPVPAVVLALGSGAILAGGIIAFSRYRAGRTPAGRNQAPRDSSSGSAAGMAFVGGAMLLVATLVPLLKFEGNSSALVGHGGESAAFQFMNALEPLGVAAMVLVTALGLARHTVHLSLGSGLL